MKTEQKASMQLKSLEEDFREWRNSRSYRSERTPEPLLERARTLLPYFKRSHLSKRLGVRANRLKPADDKLSMTSSSEQSFLDITSNLNLGIRQPLAQLKRSDGSCMEVHSFADADSMLKLAELFLGRYTFTQVIYLNGILWKSMRIFDVQRIHKNPVWLL